MTNCACVYVDDYDSPEFCCHETRKARRTHQCGECGRDIRPGEQYEKVAGKWDGRFDTHKTCADCLSLRDSFFCDGYFYGEVLRMLSEHISEVCSFGDGVDSSCIVCLTSTARNWVCDAIEEVWGEIDDAY